MNDGDIVVHAELGHRGEWAYAEAVVVRVHRHTVGRDEAGDVPADVEHDAHVVAGLCEVDQRALAVRVQAVAGRDDVASGHQRSGTNERLPVVTDVDAHDAGECSPDVRIDSAGWRIRQRACDDGRTRVNSDRTRVRGIHEAETKDESEHTTTYT